MDQQMDELHGGVSKRERHKWKLVDKPGDFAMLHKHELKVDHSYQRKHSEGKVLKLASEWSWIACGVISVAIRGDDWYVFDGWHRVMAARKRDDISKLPCMVYEVDDVAEEASGFLKTNTARKTMTMVDRFKALLMTENHAARVVNELVLASGRTVTTGGSYAYFTAVQMALKCANEDEQALRRVWPIIAGVSTDQRITQDLLGGLWYLERHMMPGESLASTHWRNRLLKVGYKELTEAIDRAGAFHGSKGLKVCALGLVQAINKGLRNHLRHTIKMETE